MHKKYIKKPIEIEALEWTGKNYREMYDFLTNYTKTEKPIDFNYTGENFIIDFSKRGYILFIKTLEGNMFADIGDFIIKGIEGEFYPCKPEIFKESYTLVDKEN